MLELGYRVCVHVRLLADADLEAYQKPTNRVDIPQGVLYDFKHKQKNI